MKYLSVCSGIEAASVAWHPLGWEPLAFSEIEPFPRAVLAHHYPDVPCYGDFTKLRDEPWIVDADILVGGTPCQAFSIAGLRNSLADDRGNLTLEYVRLANAIDDLRRAAGRQPAILVWENVPGVLSVKDNAFGSLMAGLAGEDVPLEPSGRKWTDAGCVFGPQRAIAWRTLDAQYFGLAQRRRRVFVVASARDGFDPAAVLLEFEGVRRDSPPRREAGKTTAHSTAPCPTSSGTGVERTGDTRGAYLVGDVTTARMVAFGEYSDDGTASTLKSRDYKDATDLVTHSLRGEGFDAFEDGTGRGNPIGSVLSNDPAHAIFANEQRTYTNEGNMFQLRNVIGQPVAIPLQEVGKRTGASTDDPRAGIGIGDDGDAMYTLQAGAQHGVAAYAFQPRIARNGRDDMGEVVNALNAQSGETGKGDAAPCVAVAVQASQSGVRLNDTVGTLDANYGSRRHNGVMQHMAVRRLTPEECEKLQGFPRGYTLIPWKKKPAADCPDGPRYKALGNSFAVPVVRWISTRIARHLRGEL